MHQLGQPGEHIGVRLRQHAVAEVEDVTLGRAPAIQHLTRPALDDLPRRQQDDRIEVALQRLPWLDTADCLVQRYPPVHPDDIGARLAHRAE